MALRVTTQPTYTGKLTVKAYTPPTTKLKVTTKPVNYVTPKTYNPQKSVSPMPKAVSPQTSTYNPQKTISAKQLQQAKAQKLKVQQEKQKADWAKQQAIKLRRQEDARIAKAKLQRKRLADAKNIEIAGHKQNWAGKLTLQSDFASRNARQTAQQYLEYNDKTWYPSILARQRNYENVIGQKIQQLVNDAENGTIKNEAQFNARYAELLDWEKRSLAEINSDIDDFTREQKKLSEYTGKPITSKIGRGLGTARSGIAKVGGFGFNALKKITETPERAVNTVKNLVNPNNLRLYYGGEEKKGDLRTGNWKQNIRNAYNASNDQRIVGFSKEDEAKRLARLQQGLDGRKQGTNIFGGSTTSGFLRGGGIQKGMIKYGDDIANILADPLSRLPNGWLGKSGKAVKGSGLGKYTSKTVSRLSDDFYSYAGKNKTLQNMLISREAKKANPNTFRKWLGKRAGSTTDDFRADNKQLIDFRKQLAQEFSAKSDEFRQLKKGVSGKTQAGLSKLTDDEARILQEFMLPQTFDNARRSKVAKNVFDWTDVDVPRGFNKASKRKIEDLARSLRRESDTLTKMAIDNDEFYNAGRNKSRFLKSSKTYKKGQGLQYAYVPNYSPKSVAGRADKSKTASRWWEKQKTGFGAIQQDAKKLKASFGKRANSQLYNDTKQGRWLADNADTYKDAIAKSSQALDWRKQGYKAKWFNKVNEKSMHHKFSPMRAWTKAVLPLNPSWYTNNLGTNIPSAISAGGIDTIPELLKLLRKKGRNFDDLPEELIDMLGSMKQYSGGGKLGKFASSATDDPFRIATYRSLRKKGMPEKQAIREMVDWFPDYKIKNWERPIKAVAPFYKWQEHLMKLSVKMPFKRPRSAKFYSGMHDQLFRRPQEKLPDQEQTYIDPDTGQETTFNPKDAYKGKMSIGNDKDGNPRFINAPFWFMNPEAMTDFGINPFLSTAMDAYSSQDKWGNSNANRNMLQLLAEKFPQYNLGNKYLNRNNHRTEQWFSQTGKSKWKQGADQSLPNYDEKLDAGRDYSRQWKSFLGVPKTATFKKDEFDKKFRLSKFNKDFFGVDWDKRLEELIKKNGDEYKAFEDPQNPYNIRRAEQEALAKKYGFDYQKDIIDDYWSKYDTKTTARTKRAKEEAGQWTGDFWEDYLKQPAGSKTSASKRRPYLIDKYKQWAKDNTFAENGYRRIPKFTKYDDKGNKTEQKEIRNPFVLKREEAESRARRAVGQAKYRRYLEYQKAKKSGDWSWFGNSKRTFGTRKQSPYRYDGKFFKSQESMDKYRRYAEYQKAEKSGDWSFFNKFPSKKRKSSPYQYEGKYFKSQETMDKYVEGQFWRDYYALDNLEDKQALLQKFPQFKQFDTPKTQEEWDQVRAMLRKQRNDKLDKMDGFDASRQKILKQIESSIPSGFGGKKRLKYKF